MSASSCRRIVAISCLLAAAIAIALTAFRSDRLQTNPGDGEDFPPPPYSPTGFLNTGPDVSFVGSGTCADCHRANHLSYLRTEHSRALSEVDPAAEPPDGSFDHVASGRTYRVYRADGRLRHEETLRRNGEVIARADFPMKYLVGSGHFSRTYVLESEGFLYESPITWYASGRKWAMSPGYDAAEHGGFERPIIESCLYCHAGRVTPVEGAAHRLSLPERAIGCENCHGPGSVHVEHHRAKRPLAGASDNTIVNPRKLPRNLQEDICAACHLTGASPVLLRGRSIADFRPGAPLSDYRIHYRVDDGRDEMNVVGHIEQMRLSKCHQMSELTCLTCHDPHPGEKPKNPAALFRAICMNCHEKRPCSLDLARRTEKDGTDNCIACHMPRGDTDIPHIAFTHHRIGHHAIKAAPKGMNAPRLVPVESVEHLSPADRRRNLGIAYIEAAANASYAEQYGAEFRRKGLELLQDLHSAGMRDPESIRHLLEAAEPTRKQDYAREILELKHAPANARASALWALARLDLDAGNFSSAAERLAQHNRIFASSESLRLLGICYVQLGRGNEALLPLNSSLALRPERAATYEALAEAHVTQGRTGPAEQCRRMSGILQRLGRN